MLETTSVHENICTVRISLLCSIEVFITQVGILRYRGFDLCERGIQDHLVWFMTPLDIKGSSFDQSIDECLLVFASFLNHCSQLFEAWFQLLCQHQEGCLE